MATNMTSRAQVVKALTKLHPLPWTYAVSDEWDERSELPEYGDLRDGYGDTIAMFVDKPVAELLIALSELI